MELKSAREVAKDIADIHLQIISGKVMESRNESVAMVIRADRLAVIERCMRIIEETGSDYRGVYASDARYYYPTREKDIASRILKLKEEITCEYS